MIFQIVGWGFVSSVFWKSWLYNGRDGTSLSYRSGSFHSVSYLILSHQREPWLLIIESRRTSAVFVLFTRSRGSSTVQALTAIPGSNYPKARQQVVDSESVLDPQQASGSVSALELIFKLNLVGYQCTWILYNNCRNTVFLKYLHSSTGQVGAAYYSNSDHLGD